jgi:hypothetical protein
VNLGNCFESTVALRSVSGGITFNHRVG